MKKSLFFICFVLICSTNNLAMFKSEPHEQPLVTPSGKLLKPVVNSDCLFSTEDGALHYVTSHAGLVGPWEDLLADEFKSITPSAMQHFKAIKKIVDYIKQIGGNTIHIHRLKPGFNQTQRGLQWKIDDHTHYQLCTPWGKITAVLAQEDESFNKNILLFTGAQHIEVPYSNSENPSIAEIWQHQLIEEYKILTVDGETLPEPSANNEGVLMSFEIAQAWEHAKFVPKIWKDLEQVEPQCIQRKKAAQLAFCGVLHPRLGCNSSLAALCPFLIRHIATLLTTDHFLPIQNT